MAKQNEVFSFGGMQRDVSVSKHPTTFLYDGRNVRLTAREGNTLLTITNEKGTRKTEGFIVGKYLGHCLLNQYLVVFSTQPDFGRDYITRFDLSAISLGKTILYDSRNGNLNFSADHPISTIASFENGSVQKVYWTDGLNQPRLINIVDNNTGKYNSTYFDFIGELQLQEEVTVEKMLGAAGSFAPGVIQYAFTYYRKHGQESNIFYVTPLIYISYKDRGASPEDKVENAFRITVRNIDENFDYVRIYSIQRTSLNGTPVCKRIQDVEIYGLVNDNGGKYFTYIDTGYNGDTVDPTELLYKGGETVAVKTIDQKDNTLFMGNIVLTRPQLSKQVNANGVNLQSIIEKITPDCTVRSRKLLEKASGDYAYSNQLNMFDAYLQGQDIKSSVPCGGFKRGDFYRLGLQFQYKTGVWSDPVFINSKSDKEQTYTPSLTEDTLTVPAFQAWVDTSSATSLYNLGYRKVRPVVVFPEPQDRRVICQGVACPTLYTQTMRDKDKNLYAQSSWFFRPKCPNGHNTQQVADSATHPKTGLVWPTSDNMLAYTENNDSYVPFRDVDGIKAVEIQGQYDDVNRFRVNTQFHTFHSPDVEFDTNLSNIDFIGTSWQKVNDARFIKTFSDIDIQTETPTISNGGSGFVHKSFVSDGAYGIVAGLFYDDFLVDDNRVGDKDESEKEDKWTFEAFNNESSAYRWMVYPWHRNGSLNNDINRPADMGTQTAVLKKKVISNLRFTEMGEWNPSPSPTAFYSFSIPQLFSSNEVSIVKMGNNIYQGNIDTLITPDDIEGLYIGASVPEGVSEETIFSQDVRYRTHATDAIGKDHGFYYYTKYDDWINYDSNIGDRYPALVVNKDAVRMKYKSTPHLVLSCTTTIADSCLPVLEILSPDNGSTRYGGVSVDALKANVWVPCGRPVTLKPNAGATVYYEYGDTYYQRYDCLKTYPFTREDPNQIVEIGSFLLETHVNIDGRYDRNRGQVSNINMSPQNFNLINHVYSQVDNFFNYRILDDDYYKNTVFPNQITWTKEKQSGADVDLWTNVTLASTYDMDGSKGEITSINTWKDQIYCFQNKGICNILFNSRVQIPTSDGVPIEISNSYKVDGYRYIGDGIGCNDQRLVKPAPTGIYFIDSIGSHLFRISDGLMDVAASCNMTSWFTNNGLSIDKLVYDDINHDLYAISDNQALCFSETLNQFTAFMDYGGIDLLETCNHRAFTMKDDDVWAMFEGDYCRFFDENKPWSITFISNGTSNSTYGLDKTFTNLEFRASVEGDGEYDESTGRFTPALPFDYLEAWDEHQHGKALLQHKWGHDAFQHHSKDQSATLKRKFRLWRCDIPRNNIGQGEPSSFTPQFDNTFLFGRKRPHPMDRMRNPWLYVKLQKRAEEEGSVQKKTEIHDVITTYFT